MPGYDDLDRAAFVESVARHADNESVRSAVFDLLHFAERTALVVAGGAAADGSFHYKVGVAGRSATLFTCDSRGYVSVSLGNFMSTVSDKTLRKFRTSLAAIPGLETVPRYDVRPGFEVRRTLVDPQAMRRFQRGVRAFQSAIKPR